VTGPPAFVRAPQQERSRRSFDRAVDAAVALLVERGSDAFTLAEVAERAGGSIGSIYGRVGSKDDLLRAAQAREMTRIGELTARAFRAGTPEQEGLAAAVDRAVRTMAELLRSNAAVLAPFMLLANSDAVIADAGRAGYAQMADAFQAALLAHRADIGHPDPEHACAWSCTVVYSVLARWLGLGGDVAAAGEGAWEQVVADLVATVAAVLSAPGS
jgi:AcrR family transcriptional regulator